MIGSRGTHVRQEYRLTSPSGEAIVRRLAQEDYRVTVNDVAANQDGIDKLVHELNEKHGQGTAIGVVADVTSSEQVQSLIQQSVEKLGNLTVFVANAGIAQVAPVLEISDEDVQKMFNVNFVSQHQDHVIESQKPLQCAD